MKKLLVLSGAGISAESGISTFRDAGGVWEDHDIMRVASPQGWEENPKLVLDFYNQRRRQLREVEPNAAHTTIAALQDYYEVTVVTQNVDDLHERGGAKNVIHLHGELNRVRSEINADLTYVWAGDLNVGDIAGDGAQLRPDIVWFGENVPLISVAIEHVERADTVLIIGTSLQVYPAAGLLNYARASAKLYYIDKQAHIRNVPGNVECISDSAVNAMQTLYPKLLAQA